MPVHRDTNSLCLVGVSFHQEYLGWQCVEELEDKDALR